MNLDQISYDLYFKGYLIADCVVRAKDWFYFILERNQETSDETPHSTRIITCTTRQNILPWSQVQITSMHRLVAGASKHPKEQFVGASMNNHVYVIGSGQNELESDIHVAGRGGVNRLKTIAGTVYGCGLGRLVIERRGKNNWTTHSSLPQNKSFLDPTGFRDIDGFSPRDIYAAGGAGDLWHFNGNYWKQLPFPSNMDLHTVCCAKSGYVYLGAETGSVFKGRDQKWEMIECGELTLPFSDMVCHDDAIWCTSDDGLWTITDDKVVTANAPASVTVCSGHLSTGDGVMLLAGAGGAAMHDGSRWRRIIDYNILDL